MIAAAARRAGQSVASWDRVTWTVVVLALVALVTRTVGLGERALHHDESLHLTYSWYLFEGRGYEHDPLMHGPLQFHLIAGFFWLFGDSEFIGRLPHALAGTALVASPLLLRRWFGGPGVVLAAAFLLVSPSIFYYSRFARNEPFVALFTVLMVAMLLYYRRDGRLRWLVVYSAAFALQFAAKETGYLIAAVILLYLNSLVAHDLFWGPRHERLVGASRREQLLGVALLVPLAWVIALLWPWLRGLRSRYGWYRRPRSADLLVVTATLVLPLLAAAVELPVLALGVEIDLDLERTLAAVMIPVTLILAALFGIAWGFRWWAACALAFFGVLLPLYTTWGTHPEGAAGIVWTSLDYWIDQQEVRRGTQPWFYYLWLLPLYESLVLIPGLLGGAWLVLRERSTVAGLLLFWFVSMFLVLSYAGEKMPWLTVHLALPLCLLAGLALGRLVPRAAEAVRRGQGSTLQWAGASAGATVLVLLFALALRVDWNLNAANPDTPVEPLIYVQTSPRLPELAREIHERFQAGTVERVVIHTDQSLTWPWAWYARDLPVLYVSSAQLTADTLRPTDVVVMTPGAVTFRDPVRALYEAPVVYEHRWWFPEAGYRATTLQSLVDGLLDGSLVDRWGAFLLYRGDPEAIGALRAEIYFPDDSAAGSQGSRPSG